MDIKVSPNFGLLRQAPYVAPVLASLVPRTAVDPADAAKLRGLIEESRTNYRDFLSRLDRDAAKPRMRVLPVTDHSPYEGLPPQEVEEARVLTLLCGQGPLVNQRSYRRPSSLEIWLPSDWQGYYVHSGRWYEDRWKIRGTLELGADGCEPAHRRWVGMIVGWTATVVSRAESVVHAIHQHDVRVRDGRCSPDDAGGVREELSRIAEQHGYSALTSWLASRQFPLSAQDVDSLCSALALADEEALDVREHWQRSKEIRFPVVMSRYAFVELTGREKLLPWKLREFDVPSLVPPFPAEWNVGRTGEWEEPLDGIRFAVFITRLQAVWHALDGNEDAWRSLREQARAMEDALSRPP